MRLNVSPRLRTVCQSRLKISSSWTQKLTLIKGWRVITKELRICHSLRVYTYRCVCVCVYNRVSTKWHLLSKSNIQSRAVCIGHMITKLTFNSHVLLATSLNSMMKRKNILTVQKRKWLSVKRTLRSKQCLGTRVILNDCDSAEFYPPRELSPYILRWCFPQYHFLVYFHGYDVWVRDFKHGVQ